MTLPPVDERNPQPAHLPVRRRTMLKAAAAATAIPVLGSATQANAQVGGSSEAEGKSTSGGSANDRIQMAIIGTGGQGGHNMRQFLAMPDVDVVAIADVDSGHLESARKQISERRPEAEVLMVSDYRKILDRDDIDAVVVATPDHWHALASVEAMQSGKDVYCEKPLANSVAKAVGWSMPLPRIIEWFSAEATSEAIRESVRLVKSSGR